MLIVIIVLLVMMIYWHYKEYKRIRALREDVRDLKYTVRCLRQELKNAKTTTSAKKPEQVAETSMTEHWIQDLAVPASTTDILNKNKVGGYGGVNMGNTVLSPAFTYGDLN
jgi:predicted Holliday junction resolvase-like endonuclease